VGFKVQIEIKPEWFITINSKADKTDKSGASDVSLFVVILGLERNVLLEVERISYVHRI